MVISWPARPYPGPIEKEWSARHPAPCSINDFGRPRIDDIREISIERIRCEGRCPAYTPSAFREGVIEYTGRANVSIVGRHDGLFENWLSPTPFEELAMLVEDIGFFEMEDSYCAPVETGVEPSTYISVVRGETRKTIRLSPSRLAGPPRLRALVEKTEQLLKVVKWKQH